MKVITLTEKNFETAVAEAAAAIRRGGIIVYPTDTAYGLGVDATNREAVKKLYEFKKRNDDKPTHVLVSGTKMASEYADVNTTGTRLTEEYWPGSLTIEFTKTQKICNSPSCTRSFIAMRQSTHAFAQKLVEKLGTPITTPSANFQGDKTPYTFADIIENFGDANPHIDLVIDGGELPGGVSTLVSVIGDEVEMIREGVMSERDIRSIL